MQQVTSDEDFDQLVSDADKGLVIIDCYADWCGPCKRLAPQLDEYSSTFAEEEKVNFYKLNIEDLADTTSKLEIQSMPTILFYKNAVYQGRFTGADFEGIKKIIDTFL